MLRDQDAAPQKILILQFSYTFQLTSTCVNPHMGSIKGKGKVVPVLN
jgi:hypothetical protein